jgi:hypothetical protein
MSTDVQMVDWLVAQTPGMTVEQATNFLSMYSSEQAAGSPFGTGDLSWLWREILVLPTPFYSSLNLACPE